MPIILAEGFDAEDHGVYRRIGGSTPTFSNGRVGGKALRFDDEDIAFDFPAQEQVTVGWVVKHDLWPTSSSYSTPRINDAKTALTVARIWMDNGLPRIYLFNGGATEISLASTTYLTAGTWYTMEMHVLYGYSGRIELWQDSQKTIDYTGNVSRPEIGPTGGLSTVGWRSTSGEWMELDDVWVASGREPRGERRIYSVSPTGNSAVAWTPFGTANNWEAVSDDSESTYVSAATGSGLRDAYVFSDVDASVVDVEAVSVGFHGGRSDLGDASISAVANGQVGSPHVMTGTSGTYNYYRTVFDEASPGVPWTPTNVNSSTYGVEEAT